MIIPVITLIIIHIVLSVIVALLSILKIVKLRPAIFGMVFLVPFFGPVCGLLLSAHKRWSNEDTDIQVQKFRVEKEIYKSLGIDTDGDEDVVALEDAMIMNDSTVRRNLMKDLVKDNVVPLEEALSFSKSDVRRKLMMDILTSDTAAFYRLLEQARLNDDVEVVHYATTAMSELNKQYDVKLQQCIKKYDSDPSNIDYLEDYANCLKQYLSLGFVKGAMEKVRRTEYVELLKKMTAAAPTLEHYCDLSTQLLEVGSFDVADEVLNEMESRWPVNEKVWQRRLRFYIEQKDGDAIRSMISNASSSNIYFSEESRNMIEYWKQKTEVKKI